MFLLCFAYFVSASRRIEAVATSSIGLDWLLLRIGVPLAQPVGKSEHCCCSCLHQSCYLHNSQCYGRGARYRHYYFTAASEYHGLSSTTLLGRSVVVLGANNSVPAAVSTEQC